jgi:hypothetical protein
MTEPKPKKLSRRDAIKILGAVAGATVLANLPSKWSKPQLTQGVLPAHAQTSSPIFYSVTCFADASFTSSPFNGTAGLTISPGDSGIQLSYLLTGGYNPAEQNVNITGLPASPVTTGAGGIISIPIQITIVPISANSGSLHIFWQFVDSSLCFSCSCTQTFSWSGIPFP